MAARDSKANDKSKDDGGDRWDDATSALLEEVRAVIAGFEERLEQGMSATDARIGRARVAVKDGIRATRGSEREALRGVEASLKSSQLDAGVEARTYKALAGDLLDDLRSVLEAFGP